MRFKGVIAIITVMACSHITAATQDREILQPTRDLMPLVGTRTMMQDSEGYVWYGTVEGGLCRDNGYQIDVFRNDRHNPYRIGQSNGILSLCEDSKGNIIFGTRNNIFLLDKSDYSIRQLDKTIVDGRVSELSCDAKGNIRAVTESGNYIFDSGYRRVRYTKADKENHIPVTCQFTDCYGNEWQGGINMENHISLGRGRGIAKRKTVEFPTMLNDVRNDFIKAYGGYIGHTNTEVFWTETIEAQPLHWHIITGVGTRISSVAVSKGGWLYIGDETALYRVKCNNATAIGMPEMLVDSLGNIRKMVTAPHGGIYFITPHCELAYCNDNGKVTVLQHGGDSKTMTVDSKGTVWTTDWFGNVFRYDNRLRRLVTVAEASIESGDPINSMTCDSKDNLWMVTDKMIKEYTTDGRRRTMHNSDCDIRVSQFLDISHFTDSTGNRIAVTCSDALLLIDPARCSKVQHRISLTTANIDGNTQYSFHDNTVTIPAGTDLVELFFSTFNHVNSRNVQYIYRINGGEWQRLDTGDNHITFVNLNKGRYEMEVRASDSDGFDNNDTLHIYLDRLPAYWETWWTYLIYILLFIGAIISADRFWQRYRATKNKVAELQARLDEYLVKEDASIDKVAEEITDNTTDREFIERAIAIVEANMSNSALDIDTLCTEIAMSRSSLYRKFADITGQKPTEFMRSIRLKHAAQLIKSGNHTISETAYICGFSSPSYFNRRFKEMFGVSPTEYR